MSDLGAFGAALKEFDRSAEPDTFTFFGERFEVIGEIPPMLMLQLGASATGKIGESEGLAAMWEAMRTSLGDESFARLYKLAVEMRADLDSLMRLVFALFEGQAGRPTEAASDSQPGPPTTSKSSSGSSTHQAALAHMRPVSEVMG